MKKSTSAGSAKPWERLLPASFYFFWTSVLTISVAFALPAFSAGNEESHKLADLSFLTGKWCAQEGSGEYTEENWSAPVGDSMVSYFRSVTDGKTTAYEINSIIQTPSGPVMKLKHFREGLVAWNEKDEPGDCRLVECTKDEAIFENSNSTHKLKIVYKRSGPKALHTLVEVDRSGKKRSFPLEFKLVN